ncbi:ribosomal-processing cysteine protease Prp [Caldalkalibacillus salinus]|uniref:ribosomal-processing cysteine protease Prp n=1 Tax=Caldalkalibacillus salinus TaxID=2803787 RepID=UPI001924DAC2|nr:ribosomal-processing cysteine protease Prp [Caldalkalibacillus salinus]
MITIRIKRNTQSEITAFKITGHSLYANPGEDIICSAVSAISIGTVNAVEKLLAIPLDRYTEVKDGFLHCVLPSIDQKDTQEKMQLLLEAMIVSFESIMMNEEYKPYIQLIDGR